MSGLKRTNVGFAPRGWIVLKASDVFDIYGGTTPATGRSDYWGGKVLWATPTDVTKLGSSIFLEETEKKVTEKALKETSLRILDAETLLLTSRATIGFTAINLGPVTINQGMTALIPKRTKQIDTVFYAYYFQSIRPYLEQLAAGSTFKEVARSTIRNLKLLIPPLAEQKKIADIISTVDEGIRKVGQAIEKAEVIKKGLMQNLLARGIGHKEFKQTEIGTIPKGWKIAKLGSVLQLCQYGLSIKMSDIGKYPIIKMDDMADGYVIADRVRYVDLDEKTAREYKLDKGDILFNRTNSYELVGRTGMFLLDGDYVFASYLIRLRPDYGLVDSAFLNFYLSFSKTRIQKMATRAVHQANINATNLRKLNIPLPPLPEQEKIAEVLTTADKHLELLRQRKKTLERIKKGLMNDLLTGKRRVSVGV